MNVQETLRRKFEKFILPTPSEAWNSFVQSIFDGESKEIPTFGHPERIAVDFYGLSKTQIERGRVHIPLGEGSLEISYHVSKDRNCVFKTVYEGIFPRGD